MAAPPNGADSQGRGPAGKTADRALPHLTAILSGYLPPSKWDIIQDIRLTYINARNEQAIYS